MDKLINRVERDMKMGNKAKEKKDIKVLKKADKVQDKKLEKAGMMKKKMGMKK